MSKVACIAMLIDHLLSRSYALSLSSTSEDTQLPSGDAEFHVRSNIERLGL